MNSPRSPLPVVLTALLAAAPIWAHHGSTGFDQKKPVHFTGKVSQVEWINPHIVIHLDVTGADGKVATWRLNTIPPNLAKRQGYSKESFPVGTELTVEGYQAVDGSNRVNGTIIAFQDGKRIVNPGCFAADGTGLPWSVGRQNCNTPADGKRVP